MFNIILALIFELTVMGFGYSFMVNKNYKSLGLFILFSTITAFMLFGNSLFSWDNILLVLEIIVPLAIIGFGYAYWYTGKPIREYKRKKALGLVNQPVITDEIREKWAQNEKKIGVNTANTQKTTNTDPAKTVPTKVSSDHLRTDKVQENHAVDDGIDRVQLQKDWDKMVKRGQELITKWSNLSTDLDYILQYPMIQDYTNPNVQKVVSLVSRLRGDAPKTCTEKVHDVYESTYGKYVADLDAQLTIVTNTAEAMKTSKRSLKEQEKLETAFKLLQMMKNESATPAERQVAYKRLRVLANELNILIDEDMKNKLELTYPILREIEEVPTTLDENVKVSDIIKQNTRNGEKIPVGKRK